MKNKSTFLLLIFLTLISISCLNKNGEFVCKPCDLKCDELTFSEAGICPHCKMELVKKSNLAEPIELVLNEIKIQEGSGKFLIEGGNGKKRQSNNYLLP